MKLCSKMFWGESVQNRKHELSWKIKHNFPEKGLYVIVLCDNGSPNLLELYEYSSVRKNKTIKEKTVSGAASGKQEALEVIRTIVDQVQSETGSIDIKGYFSR